MFCFISYSAIDCRQAPHGGIGALVVVLSEAADIAIFSILTAAAAPSFGIWQAKSESQTAAADLYRHLQIARQYAITLNETVSFCGADAYGKCKRSGFDHLLIFIDSDADKQLDNQEELIAKHKIQFKGSLSLNAHTAIKYKYDGRTATPASFIYCPKIDNPQLIQRVLIHQL